MDTLCRIRVAFLGCALLNLQACSHSASGLAPDPVPDDYLPLAPQTRAPRPATSLCPGETQPLLASFDAVSAVELARSSTHALSCSSEYLDQRGCVAGRVNRSFDAAGHVVREEMQVLGSRQAFPDELRTYTSPRSYVLEYDRDAAGNPVVTRYDQGGDGHVEHLTWARFDEVGRRVERLERIADQLDDPGNVREVSTYWVYDAAGALTEKGSKSTTGETSLERVERDAQGRELLQQTFWDEVLSSSVATSYDQAGNVLSRRSASPDGVEETEYLWRADGALERETLLRSHSGTTPLREQHDYNYWPSGQRQRDRFERDDGNDGVVDQLRLTSYDDAGRELRSEQQGPTGWVEWLHEHVYDAAGGELWSQVMRDGQVISQVSRIFDGLGRLTDETSYVAWVIWSKRFQYEATSSRILLEETFDVLGVLQSGIAFEYDAQGRTSARKTDHDGDGTADHEQRWLYDAGGNLLFHLLENDNEDNDGDEFRFGSSRASFSCL